MAFAIGLIGQHVTTRLKTRNIRLIYGYDYRQNSITPSVSMVAQNREGSKGHYTKPYVGFHFIALDRVSGYQSETVALVQFRTIRRLLLRPSRSARTEEYICPMIN